MLLEWGLRRAARLWPEKVAFIQREADGETRLTYAQFAERVDRLANALRDAGLRPGGRVAILMLNSHRFSELYYAANIAGGEVVPLNFRLAVPELQFMIEDAGCTMLFVSREFVPIARALRDGCPALGTIVHAEGGDAPEGFLAYEALLAAASPTRPPGEPCETDLVGLFYTGGTTGLPKGVMLSQRNFMENVYHVMAHLDLRESDVYLHVAPMFHLAEAGCTYFFTFCGATHIYLRGFEPKAVLATVERERVTMTVLVPTMITMLVNHPDAAAHDLSSLRLLLYGASPIAESTLRRAMAVLGCEFTQAYGMTEAAPILTLLPAADHRPDGSERAARRLRSAGRPVIGVEVRVVDLDDRDVAPGEVGEVIARGANFMPGYWNRPAETAEAMRGGWFRSGDLATLDEDGYLTIVDRKKDMIVTGGENVYSVEVEGALAAHPAVLECAVIGIPDERWGEVVHAVVALKPGQQAADADLIAHCHARIAGFKCPKSLTFVESLPKSGAGKILKRELREPYWTGRERHVH
jgi:long-chain acyl-CoA synthetase